MAFILAPTQCSTESRVDLLEVTIRTRNTEHVEREVAELVARLPGSVPKRRHVLANHLRGAPDEQTLGGGIEDTDGTVQVGRDDHRACRIEDRCELG